METQKNVYSVVYHSLVIGMMTSTVLFVIGVAIEILRALGVVSFDPAWIMMAGTVAMILTPVSRVVVSIYAFAVDRDFAFVGITSFVLAMIATSVLLGIAGVVSTH